MKRQQQPPGQPYGKGKIKCIVWIMVFLLCVSSSSHAYSVLSHQALIDAAWKDVLLPVLQKRYPQASSEQLKQAKAYAYGGALAPDMGYYPYGSKLFTNLVHYVRSGDFVKSLLTEARNLNEYAFALGSLCHYMADRYGHALGVNRCVPILYPRMKEKFGDTVTYAENKISHLRTEFSMDVLQTARGNYVPESYHDFIGFAVADTLLGRAVFDTYGLDIHQLFSNLPLAIGTFRWAVKTFFPIITKAAWAAKKEEIKKAVPGTTARKFIYSMRRKQYYAEFGRDRTKPDLFSYALSLLIQVLPKTGPLRPLKIEIPGPEVERIFIKSFDTALHAYTLALHQVQEPLPNINFDTGHPIHPDDYPLCDKAYSELVLKLKEDNFRSVSNGLKNDILRFYKGRTTAIKKNSKKEKELDEALQALKGTNI